MEKPEFAYYDSQEYCDYYYKTESARGRIINHAVLLERLMDDFICGEFTNTYEERNEMTRVLLKPLTYSAKARIISKIIKKHFPDSDIRNAKFPSLGGDLNYIANKRNRFAHDDVHEKMPKEYFITFDICLINSENLKTVVCYKPEDVIEIVEKINKCTDLLAATRKELWGR